MKQIGDTFFLEGRNGDVECIIMEVSPEDGRITKAKAVFPDEHLGKLGFFLEGTDYVIMEMDIISPN